MSDILKPPYQRLLEYKENLVDKVIDDDWESTHMYDRGWIRGRITLIDDILAGEFSEKPEQLDS